jgi:hypothetical protein
MNSAIETITRVERVRGDAVVMTANVLLSEC